MAAAAGGAAGGILRDGRSGGQPWRFESIDGPPPQVFDRMVDVLDSEIEAAQPLDRVAAKAVPPTACAAISRRRVVRGRTVIAWVWDVYDGNQQRALRLSGEEPAGKAGRDAWAAADDLVLRKIAQAGLERPQRHDQRRDQPRCRLPRHRAASPGGGERANGTLTPGAGAFWRVSALGYTAINHCRSWQPFLPGKPAADGLPAAHLPDISSPIETRRFCRYLRC